MTNSDNKNRSRKQAYHEAARAVACYILRKRFKCVTINPEAHTLEQISYSKKTSRPIPSKKELKFLQREYTVFLAGPIAEAILTGNCELGDVLHLIGVPISQTQSEERPYGVIFWRFLFEDTKLLIYDPVHWQAVIALAHKLLEQPRIPYKAARKIIRQAIEDYHNGVRERISAGHQSAYSDFAKTVADKRRRMREKLKASTLEMKE